MQDLIIAYKNADESNDIIAILTQIINKVSKENISCNSEEIEAIIIESLNDSNDLVRIKATELAEYSKSQNIVEELMKRVKNDSNYFVRGFSAKALGAIGNISAKLALEEATKDEEGFVTSFANQALKTINMKLSFSSKLDMLKSRMQTVKKSK